MRRSIADSIMESIVGFDRWLTGWARWHRGEAGRPDCKICHGRGVMYVPNGDDDVDGDICDCVKQLKQ